MTINFVAPCVVELLKYYYDVDVATGVAVTVDAAVVGPYLAMSSWPSSL